MRLLFFLIIALSCNVKSSQSNSEITLMSDTTNIKESSCSAVQDIENHLSKIIDNASSYIKHQKDECVLALLDTISKRAINDKEVQYLGALEAICKVSDGYVSEALMEITGIQFYNNFDNLIAYCFSGNKCLRQSVIDALSMEMSMSENRISKRKEIDNYIQLQIKQQKYGKEKIEYIEQLKKEIDPDKFD